MSSNIEVQKICQLCGKEFTAKTTTTRYCSHKCSSVAYKARKREEKVVQANQETKAMRPSEIPGSAMKFYYAILKEKEFLTVTDVSILLGCSKRTVYRLIESGTLKAVNLSERMTRIKRSEVDLILTKKEEALFEIEPVHFDISDCYHMGEIQSKFGISEKALYDIIKRNGILKIKQGRHSYAPKVLIDKLFT